MSGKIKSEDMYSEKNILDNQNFDEVDQANQNSDEVNQANQNSDEVEQVRGIKFLQYEQSSTSLIKIEAKKLIVKRLIIVILLFLCIILLLLKLLSFTNEQVKIKKYELIMNQTYKEVLQFQAEEAEKQRIRAEEELKIKMANRNINNFTQEQIEKVKNIYTSTSKKVAYLTFDDGPSNSVTPLILDVLERENIKATFFVLGTNASWNPQILKRIRKEGHYIANHGYSHIYNDIYKNYDNLINDYNLCEQAIRNSLEEPNYQTRIFRFPGGSTGGRYANFKADAKSKMQEQGITYLDWNSLTCDAEGTPTKESILENLKNTAEGKNIIVVLMHDSSTKILTYETLTDVINYLREQGYEFGNLYDLINE